MKERLKRFGRGLSFGLQGLLGKELRSRSRGWRSLAIITGYLVALALGVVGFLVLQERSGGMLSFGLGVSLFSVLALGFVTLLALITPALTAGAVSGERERKTLDLLLITSASPLGVVLGKLLGSVSYILFLLIASLPAFALVYLFGGIPLIYLAMAMAVAGVTAVTHAALGLGLSAFFKRSAVSSLVAYVLVFLLVLGLPFLASLQGSSAEMRGGPPVGRSLPAYAYVSPLVSLGSVLPGADDPGMPGRIRQFMDLLMPRNPGAATDSGIARMTVVTGFDPQNGQPITEEKTAPWVYHFYVSAGVTLFSILLATWALTPVKPWKAWLVRRRSARRVPA